MSFWGSVTNILEKQFVDRALNLSGQHRDFFCERCGRITDHISISHAGSLARVNRGEPLPMRLVSRVVGPTHPTTFMPTNAVLFPQASSVVRIHDEHEH